MDGATLATLLAVGVAAGFLSALFGIGGGIIMVPTMHYVLGFEWHEATALSLLAIATMTPTAVFQHVRRGAVSWRIGGLLAVGGVAGVAVGTWLESRVAVAWLKLAFALLMVVAGHRMVAGPAHARFHTSHAAMLVALGAGAGVASKLLGIGGGLITVPVLALFGTPIHLAVGSSLVPVFSNAAFASAGNLAGGASLWWGLALAAGGLAGIPLGARTAHALAAKRLKLAFAVALVAAALYVGGTSGAF